jgi:hypothetical protein
MDKFRAWGKIVRFGIFGNEEKNGIVSVTVAAPFSLSFQP